MDEPSAFLIAIKTAWENQEIRRELDLPFIPVTRNDAPPRDTEQENDMPEGYFDFLLLPEDRPSKEERANHIEHDTPEE